MARAEERGPAAASRLRAWVRPHARRVDRLSGGLLGLLARTWQEFEADDGGSRAAALGYYILFSLFPLTVLAALLVNAVAGEIAARARVIQIASRYLPTDPVLVDDIVVNVVQNRTTLSYLALIGTIWGGLQIFRVLERAINRAWGAPRRRGFWRTLGFSLAMTSAAGLLTAASFLIGLVLQGLVIEVQPALDWGPARRGALWLARSGLPSLSLDVALFALLYRYVPHRVTVRWRDVIPGVILAVLLWELARQGFAFYLTRFARQNFNQIYGSFGALIGLIGWVYVAGYIMLLGAEFCAVISRDRKQRAQEIAATRRGERNPTATPGFVMGEQRSEPESSAALELD